MTDIFISAKKISDCINSCTHANQRSLIQKMINRFDDNFKGHDLYLACRGMIKDSWYGIKSKLK